MATRIKMEIQPEEIIEAVKKMPKQDRDSFIEDLLASTYDILSYQSTIKFD